MGFRNIGATLSLKDGNFFTNSKKAASSLGGLEKSTTSATGKLSKLGGVAASVGKGLLTASAVGITAMTGLTVKALGMAGELEQNVGGSEAVFKDFAGTLQNVGETAFETMGLSMSDFLGTANKMGALFQGSGFTIAQSTELTTSAMQRASDVASIMGIETSAAMEAITGAAKGNFTMMDNLGVAINDTTIKNYALANGIKTVGKTMTTQEKTAIAMQMFMEKTAYAAGNYAKENATLAGSLNTAKAAFATFMSGAGSAEGIANAFVNVAGVVTDKVGELLPTLTAGITEVVKKITPKIPGLLKQAMPGIITGAMSLISGLADLIPSLITAITDSLPTILPALVSGFMEIIPKLATAIITNAPLLLSGIGEGIKAAFAETDLSGVGAVLGGAFEGLSVVLDGVLTAATNVYNFFVNNWNWIAPIIAGITGAVLAYKAAVIAVNVVEKIRSAVTGIVTAAQWLLNLAMSANPIGIIIVAIGALIAIGVVLWMNWDTICAWCGEAFAAVGKFFVTIGTAIGDFFSGLWNGICNVVINVWNSITGFLSGAWESISGTAIAVFEGIKNTISNIWNGIWGCIKGVINLIIGGINGMIRGFVDGINGLINGVNSVSGAVGIPAIPTFTAPQIPMLAKGGDIVTSGRVLVGEKGPEYLDLPKGAKVTPLGKENANDGRMLNILAGISNAVTNACDNTAAAVKGFVQNISRGFETFTIEPISGAELLKPIMGMFDSITVVPVSVSELLKPVMDGIMRWVEAVTVVSVPVPDLPKTAMDGITRPSGAITEDKRPKAPEPPKEPNPPPEKDRAENHITINIYADGKSSDEIVDDLMPKLKLALANI